MQPSPALISAVESYLRFRSAAESLKPVMDKILRVVMTEFCPQYDSKWATRSRGSNPNEPCHVGKITDPDMLFLMDEAQWDSFYQVLDSAKRAAGFSDFSDGHCPQLICESRMTDAENAIIEEVAKHPGLGDLANARLYLDTRNKLIEIALKWVVPHVSKARIEAIPLPFTYNQKGATAHA